MEDKKKYLEDEAYIVRHSGEIPEIALHGSLYYLAQDPEGPQLEIEEEEIVLLKEKVVERYCEIIRRDLEPDNRDKTIYRGVARSRANWQRLKKFCIKEGLALEEIRAEMARWLAGFLVQESREVLAGTRTSSLNLTVTELRQFAAELGLAAEALPAGLELICPARVD